MSLHYTDRLNTALIAAARAHDGQTRKGTDIPYITHPVAVAILASEGSGDEDTIIAALFHDVLEDVSPDVYSPEQLAQEFGSRVLMLVQAVSEDKRPDEPEKPWKERKIDYLEHLETADPEALVISAADKIHNLSSILADYQSLGDTLWQRFNAPKEDQLWYYRSVASVIARRLPDNPLTSQLTESVGKLKKIIGSPL